MTEHNPETDLAEAVVGHEIVKAVPEAGLLGRIVDKVGYIFAVGIVAAAFILLNQQITSYTEYWPLTMGIVLIVLLYAFPGGIVGTLAGAIDRVRARSRTKLTPAAEAVNPHA